MNIKGSIIVLVLYSLAFVSCESQKKERPSPLRADSTMFGAAKLKIEFSSPAVNGRRIWGDLVPYDQLWRTGANDATVFSTAENIRLAGKPVDAGKYAVFTIPSSKKWTFILNEHWNQWGAGDYDSTRDILRLKIDPRSTKDFSERMKFYFEDDSLKFQWEKLAFSLALE